MLNWFECKIKYEKTAEEGKIVKNNPTMKITATHKNFFELSEKDFELSDYEPYKKLTGLEVAK